MRRVVVTWAVLLGLIFVQVPYGKSSLRLPIVSGDTPHLLPPPTRLIALLGGVNALPHCSTAASSIDLPVVD